MFLLLAGRQENRSCSFHIPQFKKSNKIEHLVRDIKKYSSKQIINAIQNNLAESRKDWMVNIFRYTGQNNNNNKEFQFWKQDYHPIELDTPEKLRQRLNYLHENPVRSGLVWETWHYKYSSAIDYDFNGHGLIKIEHLFS